MRLTTKRRYAVNAMLDLALHQGSGLVSLKEIAERQGISQQYLEQLFGKLRKQGLVVSVRGPGGGYRIERDFAKLTVAQVINAIEEQTLERTTCTGMCNCRNGQPCITEKLWSDLSRVMFEFLDGVTFADLIARAK